MKSVTEARVSGGAVASWLLIGGALNGLAFQVITFQKEQDQTASLSLFGLSPFVLVAMEVGRRLLTSHDADVAIYKPQIMIWCFGLLMLWPSSLLAWCLVGALGLSIGLSSKGLGRAGALLFSALALTEIWRTVGERLLAPLILSLDAKIVQQVLSVSRDCVEQSGNVVGECGGHQIIVLAGCGSTHILPQAVLGWAALCLNQRGDFGRYAIFDAVGLCAILISLSVLRLSAMAWSLDVYKLVHGEYGSLVFDTIATSFIFLAAQLTISRNA